MIPQEFFSEIRREIISSERTQPRSRSMTGQKSLCALQRPKAPLLASRSNLLHQRAMDGVTNRGTRDHFTNSYQRAPNPPAQPRLSRVRRRSFLARGYKFGCVCSYITGQYPGILMTGHIGTNTPKFVPPRWGPPPFDPAQTGLCKFGWVWSSLIIAQK